MELLLIVSSFGLLTLCGFIYFKYQDYKAQRQKK